MDQLINSAPVECLAFIVAAANLYGKLAEEKPGLPRLKYLSLRKEYTERYDGQFPGRDLLPDVFFFASLGKLRVSAKYGVACAVTMKDDELAALSDRVIAQSQLLVLDTRRVEKALAEFNKLSPAEMTAALAKLSSKA